MQLVHRTGTHIVIFGYNAPVAQKRYTYIVTYRFDAAGTQNRYMYTLIYRFKVQQVHIYSYLWKQVHVYSYLLIQCSWFTKGTRIHLFANSMLLEYEAGTHIQLFSDTMVLVHETGTHIVIYRYNGAGTAKQVEKSQKYYPLCCSTRSNG